MMRLLTPKDIAQIAIIHGVSQPGEPCNILEDLSRRLSSGDAVVVDFLRAKPAVARAIVSMRSNGLPHAFDLDGASLWRLFEQTPRVKLPDVATIVTAATPEFWPLLQLLAVSLDLSHDLQRFCVSLGLSREQERWLARHGMHVLEPDDLIIPTTIKGWSSWNRPVWVRQAAEHADDVLWLDADTFVLRSLAPIFQLLQRQPVFTPDQIARHKVPKNWRKCLSNKGALYAAMPVKQRITGDVRLNNGVTALRFPRDAALFDSWLEITQLAAEDVVIRDSIHCWDQGAVVWSVEKHGLVDCIMNRPEWNDALTMRAVSSLSEIAERARKASLPSVVCHQAGNEKAMLTRTSERIEEPIESPLPLKVFILGHCADQFEAIAKKHYLEFVRLDQLDIGEMQQNQLCESRFFYTDMIERSTEEYIGLASASWNKKYWYSKIDQIWHLDLRPDLVWAASIIDADWPRHSLNAHSNIGWVINELAEIAGVNPNGYSLWSSNFVCAREVALDLQAFFRRVFGEFFRRYFPKYGWNNFPLTVPGQSGVREWSYIAERVSMLYFASRIDLRIWQI